MQGNAKKKMTAKDAPPRFRDSTVEAEWRNKKKPSSFGLGCCSSRGELVGRIVLMPLLLAFLSMLLVALLRWIEQGSFSLQQMGISQ
jgi:hypothetical protein